MATVLTEPKTLALSENSRIVFDFDGRLFRAAYYHPVKEANGQMRIARDTCKADSILGMLCGLFNVRHPNEQVRGVERYIRATEWGVNLP